MQQELYVLLYLQLLSKIRSFDFKEKLNNAVEWIKEHKMAAVAVASGLFIAGVINARKWTFEYNYKKFAESIPTL